MGLASHDGLIALPEARRAMIHALSSVGRNFSIDAAPARCTDRVLDIPVAEVRLRPAAVADRPSLASDRTIAHFRPFYRPPGMRSLRMIWCLLTQSGLSSVIAIAVSPSESARHHCSTIGSPKRLCPPFHPPLWLTASRLEQASLNKASCPDRL